jgi:DNA repair photolyase
VVRGFRLTLEDAAAIARTQRFLAGFDIAVAPFTGRSLGAVASNRTAHGLRTSVSDAVVAITGLIEWPHEPDREWTAGFLAGAFDADGSYNDGVLGIATRDHQMVDRIVAACLSIGLAVTIEGPGPGGVYQVRVVGGPAAHLRFLHAVEPATARAWSIAGLAVAPATGARIAVVEPIGINLPMFDITTGTGDFIANGVVSDNCFARNTHTYLDFDAGRDFDTQVVVKVNAGELLRRELAAPRWHREHIAMGTNVDVYQRAEGRYRLMPDIIAALRDFANPFSILTKGTLILRDLDLLREAASVTSVGISFSVGFLDEDVWRSVESGTPSPRRRLDAVRALVDAGFSVGVLMAPILPGLTDTESSIDATVQAIAAAGASHVVALPLHLRPGAREWYLAWLARNHPQMSERYRRLYGSGSYLAEAEARAITARVRIAARRHGISTTGAREAREVPPAAPPPPAYEQMRLL